MELNQLSDNKGARKRLMRVGRGIGSGKGKTCGRGGKGQTARTGVAINGSEGGQMPIHRRLPKRGFSNPTRQAYEAVNLADIQRLIDAGKLDAKQPITYTALKAAGMRFKAGHGVKLLGTGNLSHKVNVSLCHASASAIAAVEKLGGTVTVQAA